MLNNRKIVFPFEKNKETNLENRDVNTVLQRRRVIDFTNNILGKI